LLFDPVEQDVAEHFFPLSWVRAGNSGHVSKVGEGGEAPVSGRLGAPNGRLRGVAREGEGRRWTTNEARSLGAGLRFGDCRDGCSGVQSGPSPSTRFSAMALSRSP
jgi:hypothetical protein